MSAEKILVVEDNAMDMSILSKRLRAEGYKVMSAISGSDAIRAARTGKPDLMILDLTLMDGERLNTPLWDGFSLLEWMRRTVPGMDIPIIIHTGSDYSDIAAQARASGISSVFQKGEDLKEVLGTVRKTLDERKTKLAVGE
jgi:CheY-like chemotaxis protein